MRAKFSKTGFFPVQSPRRVILPVPVVVVVFN